MKTTQDDVSQSNTIDRLIGVKIPVTYDIIDCHFFYAIGDFDIQAGLEVAACKCFSQLKTKFGRENDSWLC